MLLRSQIVIKNHLLTTNLENLSLYNGNLVHLSFAFIILLFFS